ncbi:hypothetical protein BKA70DRAFT_1268216 [Coprinopsis sp. MPI-PUGE-AT-0042]|nr:hypothetical protein BKA70DRAFT_1268216 [Coprinopsis sp. MPI-PUGE-AT-0042]
MSATFHRCIPDTHEGWLALPEKITWQIRAVGEGSITAGENRRIGRPSPGQMLQRFGLAGLGRTSQRLTALVVCWTPYPHRCWPDPAPKGLIPQLIGNPQAVSIQGGIVPHMATIHRWTILHSALSSLLDLPRPPLSKHFLGARARLNFRIVDPTLNDPARRSQAWQPATLPIVHDDEHSGAVDSLPNKIYPVNRPWLVPENDLEGILIFFNSVEKAICDCKDYFSDKRILSQALVTSRLEVGCGRIGYFDWNGCRWNRYPASALHSLNAFLREQQRGLLNFWFWTARSMGLSEIRLTSPESVASWSQETKPWVPMDRSRRQALQRKHCWKI